MAGVNDPICKIQSRNRCVYAIFLALAVQGDIAEDIAKQIKLQITPEARASKAKRPVPSLEAQDAYLRGRYEWNKRGPESLLRARVLFKEALDRDPNYALAWVGLADTEYLLSSFGNDVVSPREGDAQGQGGRATRPRT